MNMYLVTSRLLAN